MMTNSIEKFAVIGAEVEIARAQRSIRKIENVLRDPAIQHVMESRGGSIAQDVAALVNPFYQRMSEAEEFLRNK